MNVNTITRSTEDYASGKLPIALHKNYMSGNENTYYAKAASRTTLTMQNIAEDIIVTKALEDFSSDQIVKIWNVINGAVIDRVLNGFIVDAGLGFFQARISGAFNSQQDTFDKDRHSIDIGYRSSSSVKEMASELEVLILQGNSATPEITSIVDATSKKDGILTPKRMLTITGKNIKLSGEIEDVGLWFINTEDESKSAVIKAEDCGINNPTLITCDIPDLSAGTYQIKIVTQYSKSKTPRKEAQEYTAATLFSVEE